jgi:hypothetical protein
VDLDAALARTSLLWFFVAVLVVLASVVVYRNWRR